jgi:hypothetical protein
MSGTQFLRSTTPTNALEVRGMTYGEPFPITLARKIRHAPENSRVKILAGKAVDRHVAQSWARCAQVPSESSARKLLCRGRSSGSPKFFNR